MLQKLYPQFHPKSAFELLAVVVPKSNTAVTTDNQLKIRNDFMVIGVDLLQEIIKVPLLPRRGKSTAHPAKNAPGTPVRLRIAV